MPIKIFSGVYSPMPDKLMGGETMVGLEAEIESFLEEHEGHPLPASLAEARVSIENVESERKLRGRASSVSSARA